MPSGVTNPSNDYAQKIPWVEPCWFIPALGGNELKARQLFPMNKNKKKNENKKELPAKDAKRKESRE